MNFSKVITSVLFAVFVLTVNAADKPPRVLLIGDSIVASYSPIKYPLTGWGQLMPRIFNKDIQVINYAVGGRSSKSFIGEGRWAKVLKELKPGDYLFIQWGHNDQYPKLKKRYSDPDTTFQEHLKRYISEAKQAGAHPVLVVMPVRGWGFKSDGSYHETHLQRQRNLPAGIKKTSTSYPDAVRKVAQVTGVPMIDLHRQSLDFLKQKKFAEITTYYMKVEANKYPAYPKGKNDLEHFSFKGAAMLVDFIAKDIRKLKLPLAEYLKPTVAITKALQDNHGKLAKKINLNQNNIIKKFSFSRDDYKLWHKSIDQELTIKRLKTANGTAVMVLDFTIDHQHGAYKGKYPKAWPRAVYNFKEQVNLNDFDYVVWELKIDSNREKALATIMSVTFTNRNGDKTELAWNVGKDCPTWRQIAIPISDIMTKASAPASAFAKLKIMQLVIAESNYSDKTKLQLKIKNLALIKLKK